MLDLYFFAQESVEDVAEEDVLPGGDPDAGIPADQARIHGIQRGPHISEQQGTPPTEQSSYLPAEDSLPVDVETHVDDSEFSNVTSQQSAPPDSDDQRLKWMVNLL